MLSYAQVIRVLATINDIAPDAEPAFKARLRHFQRMGFPEGSNTGKGRAAEYTVEMLLQLAVAIEFLQSGVSPARTVAMIRKNWPETAIHMLLAAWPPEMVKNPDGSLYDTDVALCVSPESLRDLTIYGEDDDTYKESFHFQNVSRLHLIFTEKQFFPTTGSPYRWLIIQLLPLVNGILAEMAEIAEFEIDTMTVNIEPHRLERSEQLSMAIGALASIGGKRSDDLDSQA